MTPPDHGGSRPGAGRKPGSGPYGERTQQIRVPESQVPAVVAYLDAYRQPAIAEQPRQVIAEPSPIQLISIAQRIPAGWPSPAADYLDDTVDLNATLIVPGHADATYVLRVSGWSMMLAGIMDGDRIVVDRAIDPQKGDIVVAVLNNDLTVKRLGEIDGFPALIPENPHFQPIIMKEGDELVIWGVVTHCLRSFKRGKG
jgi:DNA polymerase V